MFITPLGWIILPLFVWITVYRTHWIPATLPAAACLHAPAVVVVGASQDSNGYGLSPWVVFSLAVCLKTCLLMLRERKRIESGGRDFQVLVIGWISLAAWGFISAFTLPFVFEGLHTYNPLETNSIATGATPLHWHFGNAAQAFNISLVGMLFLFGIVAPPTALNPRLMANGILISMILSLAFSVLQRILLSTDVSGQWIFEESLNPSYFQTVGYLMDINRVRVGWPFSEPSYASAWFACCFVIGITLLIWEEARRGAIWLAVGAAGLINSFSATGVIAAAFAAFMVCIGTIILLKSMGKDIRRKVVPRMVILGALASLLVIALLSSSSGESSLLAGKHRDTSQAVIDYLMVKLEDHERTDNSRSKSNATAISLIAQTGGLGVGLGSNRASSYLLNFASSLGIAGLLLFIFLVLMQWRMLHRLQIERAPRIVLFAGGATMLLSITLGIPDILWPAWWIWPVLTLWTLAGATRTSTNPMLQADPNRRSFRG